MSARAGFTLIELLIVLGILGMMALVVVPSFSGLASMQVSMAAKDSLRLMRYAHNVAVQTQRPVTLTFAPGLIRLTPGGAAEGEEAPGAGEEAAPAEDGGAREPKGDIEGGDVSTFGLAKRYKDVAFAFVGYDDTITQGRNLAGEKADFGRRVAGQVGEEARKQAAETFSVTVRANGTTRPFTLRIFPKDAETGGDVVSFDFLCAGTIGEE